jgi:8-hydroxy-5-deazaflavin:NADPH oxidoreductase
MKIGIIGSGVVGQELGKGFIRLGHEVKIGTRDISKLSDWQKQAGVKGTAGSFEEAAKFGELMVLATFWSGTENAIKLAGIENFSNKILIDATNPLDFSQGPLPKMAVSPGNSGGEQIQKWLPKSKVVKAFNTISAHIMINPKLEEGEPDLFIAGNDDAAKKEVTSFAEKLGWKSVIDMGDISQAYWLETLAMIWIYYGFKFNNWTHAFKLLKK